MFARERSPCCGHVSRHCDCHPAWRQCLVPMSRDGRRASPRGCLDQVREVTRAVGEAHGLWGGVLQAYGEALLNPFRCKFFSRRQVAMGRFFLSLTLFTKI